jgi:cyclopropane fatty-acyl-phospholipid synthase-like methyltransferase
MDGVDEMDKKKRTTGMLGVTVIALLAVACGGGEAKPHHGGHGMTHDFSDVDKWVAAFDDPARAEWQKPEHVIALMEIAEGMTAADIGAGTGYFLPYLSRAVGPGGKVLGLDVEPNLVDHMTKRAAKEGLANVAARAVAPDDPGLEPASVDRVLIVDTWHHLPDRVAYAKKIAAALTPSGRLTIVDFTLESDRGPSPKHKLSEEALIAELAAGGLVARVVEEDLPDQYVVEGRLQVSAP